MSRFLGTYAKAGRALSWPSVVNVAFDGYMYEETVTALHETSIGDTRLPAQLARRAFVLALTPVLIYRVLLNMAHSLSDAF